MTRQFLLLFARYVAAIAVSFVVSSTIFMPSLLLFAWAGILGLVLTFMTIGFCGVFSGTFCLPKASRRAGSLVLLAFGLFYSAYTLVSMDILRAENNNFPFVWLIPLAGGGLIASFLFRRRPPNTALEPTAAAPSVSATPSNPKAGGDSTSASGGGGSALDR
jgi:hypothetical protein